MIVSDTGPLRYLIVLGLEGILESLYGKVLIPSEVLAELTHPKSPAAVRDWVLSGSSLYRWSD